MRFLSYIDDVELGQSARSDNGTMGCSGRIFVGRSHNDAKYGYDYQLNKNTY